jgi:predicted dehydrogenase
VKPIQVAIVGCGRISDLHALGYRGRGDARITAVCDAKWGRARAKAREWGIPSERIYADYQALLADPDIDLVELLVPHHLQKPMALTAAEADRMIQAADGAGVTLRVYENFVFYGPYIRARQMIEAGEIGEPQMIRMHVGTGTSETEWKVPLSAWVWRFQEGKCGGGPLVFDHGYHLFSLARYLMGPVERVYAWIDASPVGGIVPRQVAEVDAPATIMFQFKAPRRYGVLDFTHTPQMVLDSIYYSDDDRVEVIGERGILLINRCTARTVDLPELMLFRDGGTTAIPVEGVAWHDSFVACTQHLIDVLHTGSAPVLDGATGKAVLQFALAAHISAQERREVRPDDVR